MKDLEDTLEHRPRLGALELLIFSDDFFPIALEKALKSNLIILRLVIHDCMIYFPFRLIMCFGICNGSIFSL